ncbi:MAG: glycosyltransferase, partial [Opitutales bacterium]
MKFMHRGSYSGDANATWLRQFPKKEPLWGNCRFIFDPDARQYDWLVVYHDLPPKRPKDDAPSTEKLACHPENTLHVNYEPSNITTYGHHYLLQFGHVLTSHEPSYVRHPNRIYSQPGLPWFYGRSTSGGKHLAYDDIHTLKPSTKTNLLSTVCSAKQQKHTTHRQRYVFTQRLKQVIP